MAKAPQKGQASTPAQASAPPAVDKVAEKARLAAALRAAKVALGRAEADLTVCRQEVLEAELEAERIVATAKEEITTYEGFLAERKAELAKVEADVKVFEEMEKHHTAQHAK